MADFLFEAGVEEIPARMIATAQAELAERLTGLLLDARLLASRNAVTSYSTPRRLAVRISGVLPRQADINEQLTGPAWKVAFKDGQPTPAAIAFARKAGVDVLELGKLTTPKGDYASARVEREGLAAAQVIAAELPAALSAIPWAKSMYWRAGKPERFVRPLRWLLALLGDEVVPVEFAGIRAGNVTYGHRILHGDKPVRVTQPSAYLSTLERAHVMADVEVRRQRIRKALDAETRLVRGAKWREDHTLVDTVTHLTEWPSVLLGGFGSEYLTLPEEVLVTVMRDHQKYFAVEDEGGKLAPHFLAVLNTAVDASGADTIRHGNERVLRARFNDARFFWDTDQKIPLSERVEMLKAVTFQKDLGSYFAKMEGTLRIAEALADDVAGRGTSLDKAALLTAVRLAKTDLTAELVKEFTELQGIVGGLYARAQGHSEAVAQAIYAQYTPASAEGAIPSTTEGQLLGLADRLHTIVEMFAIGLEPTGSKDPFALRRAASGVIKILADSRLPLGIEGIVDRAMAAKSDGSVAARIKGGDTSDGASLKDAATLKAKVVSFLADRLAFYLREVRGFSPAIVSAQFASAQSPSAQSAFAQSASAQSDFSQSAPTVDSHARSIRDSVPDAIGFAEDLTAMRGSADFLAICGAFKRIKNILKQARDKNELLPEQVNDSLLQQPAESALAVRLEQLQSSFNSLIAERRYREALVLIASLRPEADAFFDGVLVMDPDPQLRGNRLALLANLLNYFSRIADFSELAKA